jgi:radical SAM superfamily enzyme YgiQ (UPF0313 family)
MRILFVYVNIDCQIGFPFGLAYLSSVLKERGYETHLLNINEKLGFPIDISRIQTEVAALNPDLVGFSIVTPQYAGSKVVAEAIRQVTDAPILCGGIHATMAPEDALKDSCWDMACVGEGEGALAELADRIAQGKPWDDIANLVIRKGDEIVRNPVRPFESLDDLPPKDYGLFDFQRIIDAKHGWVSLMASRGCPFRCSYCFNHRMVDIYQKDTGLKGKALNYVRMHPAREVIAEIEFLLANYTNIDTFIFDDDIFTLDKDYLREVCEGYKKVCDLPFVCNAHVRFFDEETAKILKDAGCRMVKFGLESGSPRVRTQIMHRHMDNEDIHEAFAAAHKFGLETSAFVMLGLPGETLEDLDMTVDLLATIKPSRFRWSIFFPFVNTDAYDMSEDGGYIDFERMEQLSNFMDASCLDFGPEQNLRIRKLRRTLPWEVNARSGCAPDCMTDELARIAQMDEAAWAAIENDMVARDKSFSAPLLEQGTAHYAIKYNEFMAILEPEGKREADAVAKLAL